MWEKEVLLKNSESIKNPIGGLNNWYGKAAEYWNV